MSAQNPETAYRTLSLEELIGRLQRNMRLYDELTTRLAEELPLQDAATGTLEEVDLEQAIQDRNAQIGLAAMEKLVIDRKVAESQQVIGALRIADSIHGLLQMRKKIEVVALEPSKERLDLFYGLGNFAARSKDKAKGRLKTLDLNPAEGGFLHLYDGRSTEYYYQAAPLVDRKNDYTPNFSITEL